MNYQSKSYIYLFLLSACSLLLVFSTSLTVVAGDYRSLDGVKQAKVVFDVSQGSPKVANLVFWAVKNVYEDKNIQSLPQSPEIAVVFHGPAVKLLTTDQKGFEGKDKEELAKFATTLQQMKNDGVKLEVCVYALKVMGVDPSTVLPQVDLVDNGFISIAGYQLQGYSVITI